MVVAVILIMITSCNNSPEKEDVQQKEVLSVSVLPLKYFTEKIAGDFVEVNVMVAEGASPATYEPTPLQMKKLVKSEAYLGLPALSFEKAWMPRFRSNNSDMKIIDLSKNIDLIQSTGHSHGHGPDAHFHGGEADPHIWVSPSTVLPMIRNIKAALLELYPEKKQLIEKNYIKLKQMVEQKDKKAREVFSGLENRSFLIFHPALGYLSRDYDLNQIIIEDQGKEPSPKRMQQIVDEAKDNTVDKVFVQKQFDVRNADAIARELGMEVIVIDPLAENWEKEISDIILSFQ